MPLALSIPPGKSVERRCRPCEFPRAGCIPLLYTTVLISSPFFDLHPFTFTVGQSKHSCPEFIAQYHVARLLRYVNRISSDAHIVSDAQLDRKKIWVDQREHIRKGINRNHPWAMGFSTNRIIVKVFIRHSSILAAPTSKYILLQQEAIQEIFKNMYAHVVRVPNSSPFGSVLNKGSLLYIPGGFGSRVPGHGFFRR